MWLSLFAPSKRRYLPGRICGVRWLLRDYVYYEETSLFRGRVDLRPE